MNPVRKIVAIVILIGTALCIVAASAYAQVSHYKAYTVFIYNFTKYVQWPEGVISNEFVIGVYGESPILDEMRRMSEQKKVGDKNIKVIALKNGDAIENVHILFVPDPKSSSLGEIVNQTKGKPVLIVTEKEGLVQKGAGISFLTNENNLRFELNTTALDHQHLKASKSLESLSYKRS